MRQRDEQVAFAGGMVVQLEKAASGPAQGLGPDAIWPALPAASEANPGGGPWTTSGGRAPRRPDDRDHDGDRDQHGHPALFQAADLANRPMKGTSHE